MKVLEYGIGICGRFFESSKSTRDSIQATRFPQVNMVLYGTDSLNFSFSPKDEDIEWFIYLGTVCMPSLSFKVDQDRVSNAIANISNKVITPALTTKLKATYISSIVILLNSMIPINVGVKFWKKQVLLYFTDPSFFANIGDSIEKWAPIIRTVDFAEPDLFAELSKVHTGGVSGGIFLSKEQETLQKIQSVKRLSFCVYSGPFDSFVFKLPLIQEKLVDLLRSNSVAVQRHCIDCISILFVKVSGKYLSHLWPILLYELVFLIY
jgi:hypothetical protein